MSGSPATPARAVPPPGGAELPAPNAAALLRRNASAHGHRHAVGYGERWWTHREVFEESCRWANALADLPTEPDRPLHVGVLLDNVPDYLFALGGAALIGATIVGLNHTRQGEALARDITHTDCDVIVTEPRHTDLLAGALGHVSRPAGRVWCTDRADRAGGMPDWAVDVDDVVGGEPPLDPGHEPDAGTRWALIFTSGTSGAPKAVICSQRRLLGSGARLAMIMDLSAEDVGYVCMPLFHSNALMVGWAPSLAVGASVGLARRFSASGWIDDVRRYRATWFNYTGKPLSYLVATPRRPDDGDNTLRVAYGNEGSPQVVGEFAERFGVRVIDAFGATEGGLAVDREAAPRAGALGRAGPSVQVVDDDGRSRPPARFDEHGRLVNAEECVGEIVNTAGAGPFEGYYNNDEATQRTTRNGWFWSGDLGYLDQDRYLYFAGRTADWIRVDGENFPAGPISAALSRHPDVAMAVAYGVPDEHAGDQVMAALIMRPDVEFDPAGFARWLDALDDVGPKWRPRYVRIAEELPTTGTNKVVVRTLVHQKLRRDRVGGDALWVRERGDLAYRPFSARDEAALAQRFEEAGRSRFWDL